MHKNRSKPYNKKNIFGPKDIFKEIIINEKT